MAYVEKFFRVAEHKRSGLFGLMHSEPPSRPRRPRAHDADDGALGDRYVYRDGAVDDVLNAEYEDLLQKLTDPTGLRPLTDAELKA